MTIKHKHKVVVKFTVHRQIQAGRQRQLKQKINKNLKPT